MKDREELTLEQKVKECRKVIESFLYFINKYVFIEDKESHIAIKIKLWPEQAKIIPTIVESMLLIVLKARQLGLTWIVAMYVLWQIMRNQLYLAVVISVTEELSIEFLDRVYFIMDRLPVWLKPPIKSRTKQILEFQHADGLVSTIKSLPTTEMGAQSKTPNLLIMDETCKNRMAKAIFNASYPGIEGAKGQVIIVSNAIKEGSGWYFTRDLFISAMRGLNKFKRIFLPWNAHPDRPEEFKTNMISSGMTERDVNENYPESEEEAITDRNIRGVYYAKQMADARKEGRICAVPHSDGHEVYTFWDLGIDDSMTIWFMQQIGREYRFIDYYENVGMGLAHYAKILKDKPYVYGDHYFPHDVAKREMGGETDVALTRKETAENLGIEPIITVKKGKDTQAVMNGIEMVRNVLGQCCFDERKCAKGILGLESYRSEWNEEKETLANKPLHNWACLSGETMIRTLDGWKRIDELVGKDFYVWGYSHIEQRLIPVKADRCWLSKESEEFVIVSLDDGKSITCTPEHFFLMRNRNWKHAEELVPGDSLMPFYERSESGRNYIKVHLNDGSIAEEHLYVYHRFKGLVPSGYLVHHVDGNRFNNNPENLVALSSPEHMSKHASEPERLDKLRRNIHRGGNIRSTAMLCEVNKLRSGDNHHTRQDGYFNEELCQKMGVGSLLSWKGSEKEKTCPACGETFIGNWKRIYCCDNCKERAKHESHYKISPPHGEKCLLSKKVLVAINHKVVKVEILNERRPVYDISVHDINCFVANGVVVHNSDSADSMRCFAVGYRRKVQSMPFENMRRDYISGGLAYLGS